MAPPDVCGMFTARTGTAAERFAPVRTIGRCGTTAAGLFAPEAAEPPETAEPAAEPAGVVGAGAP
ncbi:hypothetical protein [Streptacidiphilus sp. MAP5-3]